MLKKLVGLTVGYILFAAAVKLVGIQVHELIWYFFNFLYVVVILIAVADVHTLLKGMIERRQQRIEGQINDTEQQLQEVTKRLDEQQVQLKQIQEDLARVAQQAEQMGSKLHDEILENASREAERLRERVQRDIDQDRHQAMLELRRELTALALQSAEGKVRGHLNNDMQRRLIEDFTASLAAQGRNN